MTVSWMNVARKWLAMPWGRVALVLSLTSMTGCSVVNHMIYKTTGTVMTAYAEEHQVPYVLASDDLEMNCSMAQALTPLLMSFSRVTHTRSEEHTSELQSRENLVCRLLLKIQK